MEITIKTMMGLEDILASELKVLGAKDIETGIRMVSCQGDMKLVYRANLELRTALRVLLPIDKFMAHNEKGLYTMLRETDWSKFVGKDGSIWIDVVNQSDRFRNSQFLAQLTKDAIVDQFRDKTGDRPNVSKDNPELRLNLHIGKKGHAVISADSSGEGLHRRGYRGRTGAAPLNEVLAAGLLMLAEYDGSVPFVDPMCGSGTIACEAAMIAANHAPGLHRKFGFQQWPDFDAELFSDVRQAALDRKIRPAHPIVAADRDGLSLQLAKIAADRIGLNAAISWVESDFQTLEPPKANSEDTPGGVLVTNPPYDLRLKTGDIDGLYKEIGDTLKKRYDNYAAFLFSANRDALKNVGLRTSRKIILMNGQLEARLQKYEMYLGKK
ncbi:RNA methyltransferase [Lewinellaceae bacterium SD302]|nr:RNA methyltransferase [Lewinellaceae bacterium SD302]